jgi:uncharacterized protein involved in response to NO
MTKILGGKRRLPVPRGLAATGPVIFSYGFRPFFLAASVWAVLAMALWIGALTGLIDVAGGYGATAWHAHEMAFGYTTAVLAGFLLTAIPNWTGRLPVSGWPLILLFLLWSAGRVAMLASDSIGANAAIAVDLAFLPTLLAVCAREIVAGRKWKDLKILAVLLVLASGNALFHWFNMSNGDTGIANRAAVSAYVMLIVIMGGRVVPSFTRNWLAKRKALRLPAPNDRFDGIAMVSGLVALATWTIAPETIWTIALCGIAALLHAVRLARWQGWQTWREPLVLVLHAGYAFVPLGLAAVAIVPLGWIEPLAAFHILTVGAIGVMTLAMMARATRGHTGLSLQASAMTTLSFGMAILATVLRPAASYWPDVRMELLSLTAFCRISAFALYAIEYGPVLLARRK